MKNAILSEINRVREIMGIINEQKVKTVVGKEIVEGPMTQALNQLVREKESKLLKNWKFYITSNDNTIFLQLANKEIQSSSKKRRFIKNPTTGRQEINLNKPIVIPVSIGGEGLFEELNKYEEFNHFFNTNTEAADILKKQIQNLKLNIEVYSVGGDEMKADVIIQTEQPAKDAVSGQKSGTMTLTDEDKAGGEGKIIRILIKFPEEFKWGGDLSRSAKKALKNKAERTIIALGG